MLVEEADVEVEDPIADDVEAEVTRLDHARVDGSHRDLVRIVSPHRDRPAPGVGVVIDDPVKNRAEAESGDTIEEEVEEELDDVVEDRSKSVSTDPDPPVIRPSDERPDSPDSVR